MKSILAFIATVFAASLSPLCGAAPPGVNPKTPELPMVISNPGAEFQDDARPGAMIIGMDRTAKGRIWGCWTGTGDKADGYFLLATHILYDWNRHTDAEILMAKFHEEDVLAGRIVSKDAKLLMLANKATGLKPEKLYNGIQLPDVWPPPFRDPASDAPMPVPYLAHPPKVIPIDIGRQLFVDDFLIEKTTLKRTFHQAEKFEGNPVFRAETAVEKDRNEAVYLGQGGVFYDPSEKLFKMFYTAGWRGPLAMATSPDLKTWTRPELGLHGGNILLPAGAAWGTGEGATAGTDNALWYDISATDPMERIKFLTCWMHAPKEQRMTGLTHSLRVSDGVTWSKPVPCNAPAGDYGSLNGELRVEVLDEAGKLLATSKTVSSDNTKQRVELPGLADLAGKPVKFRFYVARGSLYAFWVTPDENGASYGNVGAGGPAFGGVRDVVTAE